MWRGVVVWVMGLMLMMGNQAEAKHVKIVEMSMTQLQVACGFTQPLFDQIEGPVYPLCAYIGTCFENCFPSESPTAEFNEATAGMRVTPQDDGTFAFDCYGHCRWRLDQPYPPVAPGYTPAFSVCRANWGANVSGVAYFNPATQTVILGHDQGCSLLQ